MTVILAATLILVSLPPLASCSSESEDVLGTDSSMVAFHLSDCSDSLAVYDYVNGHLVQSFKSSYNLRPSVYLRHGKHRLVVVSYPYGGFHFFEETCAISVGDIQESVHVKVFDLNIDGIPASPIEVGMEEVTGHTLFVKTKQATPDFGWVEVRVSSAVTKLSLTDGSYETGEQVMKRQFNLSSGGNKAFCVYLLAPPDETKVDFRFSLYSNNGNLIETREVLQRPFGRGKNEDIYVKFFYK